MPTTHRLLALLGLSAACSAVLIPSAAQARAVAKPVGPTLKIESKTCNVGAGADDRSVVLTASAVLRDAGEEVQMRFSVQQRANAKSPWSSVFAKTGDLGTWATSEPGADGLRYTKTINGLAEGTQYRVAVEARGVSDTGKVLTRVSRRTTTCVQPQISPHLSLVRGTVVAFDPNGLPHVTAWVRNTGRDSSAPVVVTVRDIATQGVVGQQTFEALPGKSGLRPLPVTINGCPGKLTVTAQETGAPLTGLEPDQSLTLDCTDPGA